jgi:hypothetical protein
VAHPAQHKAAGDDEDPGQEVRQMANKTKPIEPDGHGRTVGKATEDDVEGHGGRTVGKATEDDVEGHSIGVMNPMLARDLARARDRDIQREASRNSLINEAKRALGRKR